MANTYTYTGPGTRWAEEDPTAEDYLNVARINCDHLHEALNLLTDSNAADGTLKAGAVPLNTAVEPEATLTYPDSVETGQNAKKIIFVDLDDPNQLWDYNEFMQQIQDTSWHDALGDPPVHGLMWITEAEDGIVWWNRETSAIYMQFDDAANDMLYATATNDLFFLDGVLYVASDEGAQQIDFLRDTAFNHRTNGRYQYKSDIAGRDTGVGYDLRLASMAVKHNTGQSIPLAAIPT